MDIYMISMSDHPISLMYQREVEPSWKDYNLKKFEAVTPKDLYNKHKLDFGTLSKRDFTSTEISVWYSHFELWCKCVRENKELVVIEHDSKLIKKLPKTYAGIQFLSFINRDYGNKGIHLAPGSGYRIGPKEAERLVAKAVSNTIHLNSDGFLGRTFYNVWKDQNKKKNYKYIEQINFDGLNTIDHKNKNRKFIGPDYEDFDLSSVHGQA